jgi:hypothetical protein
VSQPINAASIGNWKNFATELERVAPLLAETMRRGGYSS